MKIILAALTCLCFMSSASAEDTQSEIAAQKPIDCSNMSMDMQQFAAQLSTANKKMFCGQFSATQRSSAMQYASQQDSSGNMMSANQAVQKVATDSNMMPSSKSPTGCPVK